MCFSLSVREQVLHPYKSTGKIIVLYIVIFVQGVSGGIVNILGGGSMDYSE
jgi:hypothetical protein